MIRWNDWKGDIYHQKKKSKFGEMDHPKTPNGGPKMPVSALSAESIINDAFLRFKNIFGTYLHRLTTFILEV